MSGDSAETLSNTKHMQPNPKLHKDYEAFADQFCRANGKCQLQNTHTIRNSGRTLFLKMMV